ncbi:sensor histidine kinase [Phenylobacterium conjunctum]|jgi:signal transduction histidine kinase|uniref:histidine kinase n=1 Tax=Phenylobacterium conjunctum TaxID=1298959 RepID=A0ABW3T6C0_9CAUL
MTPRSEPRDAFRPFFWIAASALVLVVASLVGGIALLLVSIHSVDRLALEDERALIRRTISRDLERMAHEVSSATVWDEAVDKMSGSPDMAWADINFADYYHRYFDHDLTFVVRSGQVIYASHSGVRVTPKVLGALPGDTARLAAETAQAADAIRATGKRGLEGTAERHGLLKSGGDIYLTAVAAIVSEGLSGDRPGATAVVVSARRLDSDFLKTTQQDLGVSGLQLEPAEAPVQPTVPLLDFDGKPVGVLTFAAASPGKGMIATAGPWLGLLAGLLVTASLVIGSAVAAALRRMMRDAETLKAAKIEAEAANAAKTLFLANMSHEIRTPLNGVLGMAQVMAADELPPRQAERLRIVQNSAEALLTLLNGVIEAARLESGRVQLRPEPFDLPELVQSVCGMFSGAAAAKHLDFEVAVAPELKGLWRGDATRIRQVLSNLVANAVKFTPVGRVEVRAALADGKVRIEVEDTGPGVAPRDLPLLFKVFSQVDPSFTRPHEGAGLGLAICHDLVELMGGKIGVSSQLGRGSLFHVELPLPRAEQA